MRLVVALGERLAHTLLERLEHRGEAVVARRAGVVVERIGERGGEVEAAVAVACGRGRERAGSRRRGIDRGAHELLGVGAVGVAVRHCAGIAVVEVERREVVEICD